MDVAIAESPEAVAERVDVLLITAADGRAHRPLFERIVQFKRPTFIEKPLATSSHDAQEIFRIAAKANVPVMSCSTARFGEPLMRAVRDESLGKIIGCDVFGPMPEEPTQPGLFWYGVHSIEVLNVVMGRGCREVRAYRNDDCDLVTAMWEGGRVATFRGMRKGEWKFGMTLHRERGVQFVDLAAQFVVQADARADAGEPAARKVAGRRGGHAGDHPHHRSGQREPGERAAR